MEKNSQEKAPWSYNPDLSTAGLYTEAQATTAGVPLPTIPEVSWTASEYISHEKNATWYIAVTGGSLVLVAVIYLITKDWIASTAVFIASLAVLVYGGRKPQTKNYSLSEKGITIGEKHHMYAEFRSFSIVEEEAINSIWLKPLKRFTPIVVMYYAPDDEQRIVDTLANFLPHEERKLDAVDRFSKRIRF